MHPLYIIMLCMLALAGTSYMAKSINDMPLVYVGSPSNQCKQVLSKDPIHTCDNLPRKYGLVWVADEYQP